MIFLRENFNRKSNKVTNTYCCVLGQINTGSWNVRISQHKMVECKQNNVLHLRKGKSFAFVRVDSSENARNLTFGSASRLPCAFAAALFICLSAATHV